MHLELFLFRVLIPCAPVVGVQLGAPAVFLRDGYAGYVTSCRVLVVLQITSFLSSVMGLEFLPFDGGIRALLQSQFGMLGLYALLAAALLAPAEEQIATQWQSWHSSSWAGET
jgi:hypothetical protein